MADLAAAGSPMATSKQCMRCSAPCIRSREARAPSVSMTSSPSRISSRPFSMRCAAARWRSPRMSCMSCCAPGTCCPTWSPAHGTAFPPDSARVDQLLAELDALADGGGGENDAPFEFVPTVLSVEPIGRFDWAREALTSTWPADEPAVSTWKIAFAPSGELYGTGNEPLALLRALEQLGALTVDVRRRGRGPACGVRPGAAPVALGNDVVDRPAARKSKRLRVRGRCCGRLTRRMADDVEDEHGAGYRTPLDRTTHSASPRA
jgi:hypothetical protein